jgi:N-acetylmuramoyl-L-alanine amidase
VTVPGGLILRLLQRSRQALLIGCIPAALWSQENTLSVTFPRDPSRSSTIGVFRQGGILYGSLNDLATTLSLASAENTAQQRLEIKQPPLRLKVCGNNPFLIVTDQSQRQRVYQLPTRVIHAGNAYFIPLATCLPLLNEVFNAGLRLDVLGRTLFAGTAPSTPDVDFTTVLLEPKSNGMLVRIPCSRPLKDLENWLRDDGWLYVTIADARADVVAINRVKPSGLVKQIVAIQSPTSVQLTFKLEGKIAASEILRTDDSNDILILLRTPGAEDKLLLEKKQREIQAGLAEQRKRWELDVIVIDAGHGGVDYGAIGVSGVREKDVTLGTALKLGKLIQKSLPGVKVVYTRKDDRFVPLYRRGQIANEADGKLFISIHANSLRRKPNPTRGFEVYLLRPGRTDEAVAIAEAENAVIELEEGYEKRYQKLTDENFILVTMAQSQYVRASELFAEIATQELEDHLSIPNRGVKQAGFLVLVGASMPNVLVETAYLSNREDERFLRSEAGQRKMAEALFTAVSRYKTAYEKLLDEGKDLGQR